MFGLVSDADDTNYGVPKDVQAGLWFLRLAVDKCVPDPQPIRAFLKAEESPPPVGGGGGWRGSSPGAGS